MLNHVALTVRTCHSTGEFKSLSALNPTAFDKVEIYLIWTLSMKSKNANATQNYLNKKTGCLFSKNRLDMEGSST